MNTLKLRNTMNLIGKMIQYNFRIIFGGRFIWFLLSAFAFYVFISIMAVWNGELPDEEFVYGALTFPAILLIFYPMTFGIQNDLDAGILEILFGIPDYRYKVWLVRLILVFVLVFFLLLGFAGVSSIFLARVDLLEMSSQLMFPVFFLGSMAFMFSTIIKNGNGTAVVMVIFGVIFLVFADALERTFWNVFLNPFNVPRNMNEVMWEGIALKNRIFLVVGALVFVLYGLFNLQKREKFI
jgi:hypothetical protein